MSQPRRQELTSWKHRFCTWRCGGEKRKGSRLIVLQIPKSRQCRTIRFTSSVAQFNFLLYKNNLPIHADIEFLCHRREDLKFPLHIYNQCSSVDVTSTLIKYLVHSCKFIPTVSPMPSVCRSKLKRPTNESPSQPSLAAWQAIDNRHCYFGLIVWKFPESLSLP